MSDKLLADRYEILEKVGEGGMAYVYKGKDTLLNRFVAIKVLKPEYTQNEKFVENFLKESQSAACLTCPNIVGVYDVGHEGRIHYIVMELVNGETLSEVIAKKGKLPYEEAIKIAKQILNALNVAHKNQIIHRDVKPHNIIITEDGTVKLADFGIARPISQESIKEGNEEVMGSVHYFSPEQARGAYVDERSDIYSLGIVLYELLTGEVPFDGDSAVTVALKHINEPMPRLLSKEPSLPPKLAKVIDKATEKFQSNRYSTAAEMIKDLEDIEHLTNFIGEKHSNVQNEKEKEVSKKKKGFVINTKKGDSKVGKEEIKKESRKSNRKNKKSNVVAIICAAFILVVGVVLIGLLSGWFSHSKEFELPNFVGKTIEEVQIEADSLGFILKQGEDVYSQTQMVGLIDSQVPTGGTTIKAGSEVTVYVSKGKKNNAVPNVLGYTLEEAKDIIVHSGFTVGSVSESESTKEKGTVISQSIEAGSSYKSGEAIDIVLSSGGGDNLVEMDYLIGLDFDSAKSKLEGAGLKVGNIIYDNIKSGESNIVTWQSVKAGFEIKKGEAIDLHLTKAPEASETDSETNSDSGEEG